MAARALPEHRHRILCIVGTRPEAIKMAPVIHALANLPAVQQKVLLTGQHPGLAESFRGMTTLELELDLREHSPGEQCDALLHALSGHLAADRPDMVIVQGDTTSALAGALAARERGIPVAHVEAGLRTYNEQEPWPEESNRVRIDALADLLFAPTPVAAANLEREQAVTGAIHITGNSGIDAFLDASRDVAPPAGTPARKTILVTCHRRENRGSTLKRICETLKRLVDGLPVEIIYVAHLNPSARAEVEHSLGDTPHIRLLPPQDHCETVRLIHSSWILLTDSGGFQEEGPAAGKPVLVMRNITERVEAPANMELVGTDPDRIVSAVHRLLIDEVHYARMAHRALPFGDGNAAPRIARLIEDWLAARPGGPL